MGGSSAGSGNGGGGGSPNQMAKDKAAKDKAAKDKAAKDKAVRDKEARQKEIREEQNNKQKVTVPEKKTDFKPVTKEVLNPNNDTQEKKKVIIPEKKTDFKSFTKETLNPNNDIQEKKKTPVVIPKDNDGGNNNNQVVKEVTKTAPTTAEVSQATTAVAKPTETAETTASNRLLKIKKRGRSQSIMTSSKGVTKTSANYSLGRRSLLGRV
jgi:hypothetical protein